MKPTEPNCELPNNLIGSAPLEEVQALAASEHRPAEDILREAVALYPEHHTGLAEVAKLPSDRPRQAAPAAGAGARIRERRKYRLMPEGTTIRDRIDDGRA